ncbi:CCR4-NOT transcription complex subunit 3 [Phthorimaea operculella]|nr:CCR4-NOT transcription complex subunit 3 [Phthorimaea operculella]
MAATRKLQGEIDRCLKKVTEGVETFEDIWQKVHNATNSNQKEKYEADLKKEIKKLQRLRDQIKSWIASGEIKDKSTLLEYRKLIETQMERFKVVERETKTKAYSKEGLGAAQKLDPAQKEREEMSSWLISSIDALNLQVDQFESEIESLLVGKKKRLDKEKQDRMEELKVKLEKHRFHIKKLETLLRMLDNMSVEVEQIKRIREDVEYYIDSSLEPGFEENDYIYDDIRGLDEIELSGVGLPSSATTDSNNSNDSPGSPTSILSGTSPITSPGLEVHNHSTDSIDIDKKKKDEAIAKPVKPMAVRASNAASSVAAVGQPPSQQNIQNMLNNSQPPTNNSLNNSLVSVHNTLLDKPTYSKPKNNHVSPKYRIIMDYEVVENGPVGGAVQHPVHHQQTHHAVSQPPPTSKSSSVVSASVSETASPLTINGPTQPAQHHTPQHAVNNGRVSETSSTAALTAAIASANMSAGNMTPNNLQPMPANMAPGMGPAGAPAVSAPGTASLKSMAQEAVQRAGLDHHTQQTDSARRGISTAQAHIPPLLGVAPLGPLPLSSEHQLQFQMMEASFYHMPHPSDSERTRVYLPRNICQPPLYYNQVNIVTTNYTNYTNDGGLHIVTTNYTNYTNDGGLHIVTTNYTNYTNDGGLHIVTTNYTNYTNDGGLHIVTTNYTNYTNDGGLHIVTTNYTNYTNDGGLHIVTTNYTNYTNDGGFVLPHAASV